MASKTADKYKAIVNISDFYSDVTLTGMSQSAAKDLEDGKSITKAQVGPAFDYMLKNKLIEKE